MFLNLNDYCNLVKKRVIIKFNRLLWKSFYKGDVYARVKNCRVVVIEK